MQFTPSELAILRQAAQIILQSQVADRQENNLFTVTHEWINKFRTPAGSWRAKQLAAIGVKWPPQGGWPNRVEGTQITQVNRQLFESFSGDKATPQRVVDAEPITVDVPPVAGVHTALPWDD